MTEPKTRNKWHPLRLMREWDGRQVLTLRDLRSKSGDVISAGTICEARGQPGGRLGLSWNKCWIARVSNRDVELLPETPRSRWVWILVTIKQEYVCSGECARKEWRQVGRRQTSRYAAETSCCVVCKKYGTFPKNE